MDVASMLKELRLMKGQQGYRFCLAWVAVVAHILGRRTVYAAVLCVATLSGSDEVRTTLVPALVRAIGKLL